MGRNSLVVAGCAALLALAGCDSGGGRVRLLMEGGAMAPSADATTAPFNLAPAADVAPPDYAGDKGPAQVFEIIRPEGEERPLVLGRLWMDCVCVQASAEKTVFGPDERALITVRHVLDAPAGGATYNVNVQLRSPTATLLAHPVHVQ